MNNFMVISAGHTYNSGINIYKKFQSNQSPITPGLAPSIFYNYDHNNIYQNLKS